MYILASVTKGFTAAALGILVDEGKLQWDDLVSKHVPEFNPTGNPQIAKEADFYDLLRHTSGISHPVASWFGPHGTILLKEDDFFDMVNSVPTTSLEDDEQYLNNYWIYGSASYGVAAKAVERLSGMRYSDFLQERIFGPLGMHRTAVTSAQVDGDSNIAFPYTKLQNGEWAKLHNEWTNENNTSIMGSIGLRSSVNDLLIWSAACMSEERGDTAETRPELIRHLSNNPLRQMSAIRTGLWTRPPLDNFGNESGYCMGWLRAVMPTSQVGWGSFNDKTTYDEEQTILKYLIGTESPKKLMLKHHGINAGSSACIFNFPETCSAVVVLCNGLTAGDAADFAAQVLIQELFELKPHVDLMPRVRLEVERCSSWFYNSLMADWLEHRELVGPEKPRDVLGDYQGLGITISVRMDASSERLSAIFNGREDYPFPMEYYAPDTYSFMPTTKDEYMRGAWIDWDSYEVALLRFQRGGPHETVNSLVWCWDAAFKSTCFWKVSVPNIAKLNI
ncbi:Protein flp [Lasiodiplodia hormozganensis]|uniref:Protein flp n=1 Tax=Lasiodiplodia hormozganensis TaxID=869390 RepID=A0AA40CIW3_9PEZI|nr:Protein flp [Lasiodiplodia hormozganensis]